MTGRLRAKREMNAIQMDGWGVANNWFMLTEKNKMARLGGW
jgi:hypothetical protein